MKNTTKINKFVIL